MARSEKYHLNKIHTLFELVLRRPSPTNIPIYCMHEPTTGCNLKCPACPTGVGAANLKETATLEDYETVCREFGDYLDIYYLYNWGEPTMAKSFLSIISRLSTEPFRVHVSSNFSVPLKDELIRALAEAPNLSLRINIDGATQETHEKYRINSKLAVILDNCERLSRALKTSATPPHSVHIGFLAFDYNASEAQAVIGIAEKFGFRFVSFANPLVAGESIPIGDVTLQPAFGCTWLYAAIVPSPRLTRIAPCCGVWDGDAMSERLPDRSLHETFMHETRYTTRRAGDAQFATLPEDQRRTHLINNLQQDVGMALQQKTYKTDVCVSCTMGKAYQAKLTDLVNGAATSYSKLMQTNAEMSQRLLFSMLQHLVPGQERTPHLRERLYEVLDLPPAAERTEAHYGKFHAFLSGMVEAARV